MNTLESGSQAETREGGRSISERLRGAVALAAALIMASCAVERENDDIGVIGADTKGQCSAIVDLDVATDGTWTVKWSGNEAGLLPPGGNVAVCKNPGTKFELNFVEDAVLNATDRTSNGPVDLRFTPQGGNPVVDDGISVDGGKVDVEVP